MRYILRFGKKEITCRFNRERLVLAAMQNKDQLFFMMDTQPEGIYQRDAAERKLQFGENLVKLNGNNKLLRTLQINYRELESIILELSRQKASVFRKGLELYVEINCNDIVPGDMLFLSSGDIIPADVRLIYENSFYVDQHIFTGNSDKVRKKSSLDGYTFSMHSIADIPNICLMGTRVVGGVAKALAIGTGSASYLGKLVYGY